MSHHFSAQSWSPFLNSEAWKSSNRESYYSRDCTIKLLGWCFSLLCWPFCSVWIWFNTKWHSFNPEGQISLPCNIKSLFEGGMMMLSSCLTGVFRLFGFGCHPSPAHMKGTESVTCSCQTWNLSFHSATNCFQLICISTFQPLHDQHHHFCSFCSQSLSTSSTAPSVFPIYHWSTNMPWGFFFPPTSTLFDPETIQQANVACDHSFVIINESSAEILLWYIFCCIARSVSFNESRISGNDAESDWQQEGSCHGRLVGLEKHCVNWEPCCTESGSRLPSCHVCLTGSFSEPGDKGVARDVKRLWFS